MPTFRGNRNLIGVPLVATSLPAVKGFYAVPVSGPAKHYTIAGVTKDSAGAAKASATVYLFLMAVDPFTGVNIPTYTASTISDATGNYAFEVSDGGTYWITDYKTGAPDVAGATLQTLTGV